MIFFRRQSTLCLIQFLAIYDGARHNKPLQASVRAVDHGTLWALKREDFRGILMSEFSNLASLKLLRSVDLLSRLTILQLSHVAESLSEACFSDGQTIVTKVKLILHFVKITKLLYARFFLILFFECIGRKTSGLVCYPEGTRENYFRYRGIGESKYFKP